MPGVYPSIDDDKFSSAQQLNVAIVRSSIAEDQV